MNKLLESLSQFNRREQLTLFLGVLALIIYLLWVLIFSPLQHKRNLLLTTNVSLEQSYGQVQMLAQQIQEQMQQSTQGGGVSSDSLSGLIDSSLRENGMSMSAFQPGVNGEARVRIDKANSPTDYLLEDWQSAGLRKESVFRAYFGTYDQRLFSSRVGKLSDKDWKEVKIRLRMAIEVNE